jgi:hypothetical protein
MQNDLRKLQLSSYIQSAPGAVGILFTLPPLNSVSTRVSIATFLGGKCIYTSHK